MHAALAFLYFLAFIRYAGVVMIYTRRFAKNTGFSIWRSSSVVEILRASLAPVWALTTGVPWRLPGIIKGASSILTGKEAMSATGRGWTTPQSALRRNWCGPCAAMLVCLDWQPR